jgi:hypothetical protein
MLRAVTEAVHPRRPVDPHRCPANEGRQLTRAATTKEIHLKEPLLRVQKAEAAGSVEPRGRANRRHTGRIPLDGDRRSEPRQLLFAGKLRKAASQVPDESRGGQQQASGRDKHAQAGPSQEPTAA